MGTTVTDVLYRDRVRQLGNRAIVGPLNAAMSNLLSATDIPCTCGNGESKYKVDDQCFVLTA